MIAVVEERHARVGIAPLCDALGLARATFYRRWGWRASQRQLVRLTWRISSGRL
jgi:hypothetical protein